VADAQVVAVDIDGQTRCAAFVIPRARVNPDEAELRAGVGRVLAAFKVPARIWTVDAFPSTQSANGVKIQRARLREMAMQRLESMA